LAIYVVLLLPVVDSTALVGCLVLFGAYYAATDGVLMAFASSMLPADLLTTGLAALTAATGLASLAASLVFGTLWTLTGADAAVSVFVGGMSVAILLTIFTLWQTRASQTRQAIA
jgi:hypothetical protein